MMTMMVTTMIVLFPILARRKRVILWMNNNNIIVPANVITELAKALQEDRNSQRAHEMAAVTAILA